MAVSAGKTACSHSFADAQWLPCVAAYARYTVKKTSARATKASSARTISRLADWKTIAAWWAGVERETRAELRLLGMLCYKPDPDEDPDSW
jgi:hypothetical protein